jgi:hypothetical protein
MTDSNREGHSIDWKDALGLSVLASNLLASLESNLNLGTKSLLQVCEQTSGFIDVSKFEPLILDEYVKAVKPQLMIRKWNTMISLQLVLKEVGPALGIDAYSYQEQIVDAYNASVETWNETVMRNFGSLFTSEFFAKIFARASYLKNDRGMSEEEAIKFSGRLLGWGAPV